MAVRVEVRGQRKIARLVEAESGKIARTVGGKPVDGGGHPSKAKAQRQADHVNAAPRRKNDG
jgi:hypothetical protein